MPATDAFALMTRGGRLAAFFLVAALGVSPAFAPSAFAQANRQEEQKRQELEKVQRDLEAAKQRQEQLQRDAAVLSQDIEDLRNQMVAAGRSARENEANLTSLEDALAALERDAAAKRAVLEGRQVALGDLLGALQRLSIQPPAAMAALPRPPRETVEAAILLRATLPAINDEVAALRDELAALAQVEGEIRKQRQMVAGAARSLAGKRRELDQLAQRKAAMERRTLAESGQNATKATQLASSAKTLKDLIDKLASERAEREAEAERRATEAAARANQAPGHAPMDLTARVTTGGGRTLPSAGRIVSVYGQQTDQGLTARGITIETRPEATVVAPFGGHVLFAGPFRGYGQILIIEHPDGYHSLLSGMGRIDTEVGRTVASGEPVGTTGRAGDRAPTLYFELRRAGQPTNPQPWLAAQRGR